MTIEPTTEDAGGNAGEAIKMRLLKFSVATTRVERRSGEVCLLVDDKDRRLEIPAGVVEAAVRDGLLEERGGRLTVRAEGRAFLKRCLSRQGLGADAVFAAQHGRLVRLEARAGHEGPRYNLSESPLASLARLKGKDGTPFLDEATVAAGERLRADFTRSQMQPRITANWEAGVSRGPRGARNTAADLSDTALAARLRVDRAIRVVGPDLGGVVLDVCCFLKGLETVERERQWPSRSGKLMLRTGLRSLARHYGLMR